MKNTFYSAEKKIPVLEESIKSALPSLYEMENDYQVKVLKYSENITFLVTEPAIHRKRVFRVNRPDYHDMEELKGEILWMQEVSQQTDLILPKVYAGFDGEYIQSFEQDGVSYTGIMISFLEGKIVGELEGEELNQQMIEIGKILAKLHLQSQNRNKKVVIKRSSWGINDFFAENARWGTWRDNKKLTEEQIVLLEQIENIIIERLNQYGMDEDRYGLIHADLHCSNIIVNNGISQVFDFDDSGYGWYLYDFGCSLVEYANPKELLNYMVIGYESVRKLTEEDKELLNLFVLLRKIVRLAWIAGHSDNDTVKGIKEEYYAETFKMAEEFYENCYT